MSVCEPGDPWCETCGSYHCAEFYCGECVSVARERIAELEAALRRYGLHEDGCMGRIRPNECTCGLTAAVKECLRREDTQIV